MRRKSRWTAPLGNFFEHYDTALFGFLSPFLATLIFPNHDPLTALILTYAIVPIGMIARPIGSLVFGYIGDVYGLDRVLFFTLSGMALLSGCIALIPTYSQVGIFAPVLFFVARIGQNFLAAGETVGGALFLLETSSEKNRDFLSSLYDASTMGGHLLASFGVFIISHYNITSGWRLLYVCGCITGLFGSFFRYSTPNIPKTKPFSNIFWEHRKALLAIGITTGFATATYSLAIILMNGLIPLISPFTKSEVMKINTYLLIFDFCALPFFGWLASKISREKLMLSASLSALLFAIPLFCILPTNIFFVRIVFISFGVAFFAPFYAWAHALVPEPHRYAVISFGYALGYQLLGSPTAAISLWCFQKTHMLSSVAWYWMLLAFASSITILLCLKKRPIYIAPAD